LGTSPPRLEVDLASQTVEDLYGHIERQGIELVETSTRLRRPRPMPSSDGSVAGAAISRPLDLSRT